MDSRGKVDSCIHTTYTPSCDLQGIWDVAESSVNISASPISSDYPDLSLSFSPTCPASHSYSMAIIYKSHQDFVYVAYSSTLEHFCNHPA